MKFMKLGSKPDTFQTDGNNVRYVVSELASDIIVIIGDIKFYLHKFPLLSKSSHLQKLITTTNEEENRDEIQISDIPGGASAFEICAKFCYGMTVTLNAYNVIAARCAAEYLGMHETIEKGNLIYKIDVFLSSSIFHSWKDSIIVLQTSKSISPLTEDLKVVNHCIESIANKASVDLSKVDWSYSYNRKKLPEENGVDLVQNGVRARPVPKDWWVEDLCELEVDLYKSVITNIQTKAILSNEVIGEALKAYAYKRLPNFSKGMIQCGDVSKYRSVVETIVWLLPDEKGSVSCRFLLKLLKAANFVESRDKTIEELVRRIGQQLEEASVGDILIPVPNGETSTTYDVSIVQKIVKEYLMQDQNTEIEVVGGGGEHGETRKPAGILSDASKLMVAKLIDGYLAEIAKDPNLPLSKFVDLAELVSGISRPAHDGLYRAIDMYLKTHPGMGKGERKRICKLMDCKKLSVDACMHAVQNERLPLRVVVQVLYFEQVKTAASSGASTPGGMKDLNNGGSHGSSRSGTTANTEDDLVDGLATAEELKALRKELASLRMTNEKDNNSKANSDKAVITKMKGLLKTKRSFMKMWANNKGGGGGENSGSDSSESIGSANPEEAKSTPSRNRRYSVS